MDGNTVVIMCERESSDAAGAYPITPSTQMGEYWAEETAKGHINISGKPLIFIEPEGEHAAAGVTAGMSMTGLRASNFSSGQGIAYMHESLYGAVGKRLPYILNVGCRAITKATLNVHAGHDDYHLMDDTGFFQVLAKNGQGAADLNVISRKIAELSLTPGAVGQDGFLTTHLIETLLVPERELIAEYLGRPDDLIETPTPAQKILYGEKRRRVPILWDVDNPVLSGSAQNQDAYMQSVAAQRPYFFEHIPQITDQCMAEYAALTGREYKRVSTYRCEDADYLVLAQGSIQGTAEAVVDYLRETRNLKVGVVDLTMFRPFPGDLLGAILKGRKGVVIPERTDQPLAEDLPVIREVRAAVSKCIENGLSANGHEAYPQYETYSKKGDAPPLYSCSFGLGSRDLQPEAIIGAIENMLPDGAKKRFFYLSIDFLYDKPNPKLQIREQRLLEAYPNIGELAVKGSENPNLLPKGAVTVRMHSVGGWGAITTGKNLAVTLNELLGYDIKANPKYGSEKKGQPTTYYLSAAPEPIRINCEYNFVDTVLSPDPNVFSHSNPFYALKKGGTFIIQSDLESPEEVWKSFPIHYQKQIIEKELKVVYLDAFKIAREEATDPELQFRMQGIAFQGAFFAASNLMETANFTEESLFKAIKDQIEYKFGSKGARIVEDNIRVVRRGFDEIVELKGMEVSAPQKTSPRKETSLPLMLKRTRASSDSMTDTHRFWEQTGSFYLGGRPNDHVADPFSAMALIPANTGLYRNMTQIRFQHPVWNPEKCTACSDCFTVCPDAAIPGLACSISAAFESTIKQVVKKGHQVKLLHKSVRVVEKKIRTATAALKGSHTEASIDARPLMIEAISDTIAEATEDKDLLIQEFEWFRDSLGDFKFAFTKPYYDQREKKAPGSGGLYAITINPYTCKGCMLCVDVCEDNALTVVDQTTDTVKKLETEWDYWLDLPTTSKDFMRIDDIDEKVGALETMLMDKSVYSSMSCGDGACTGCGEKTVLHLFTSTITALMQGRVKKHIDYINDLIGRLEAHLKTKLADTINVSDPSALKAVVERSSSKDLNLSHLAESLDEGQAGIPLDQEWLTWMSDLLAKLKDLKWRYEEGTTKTGRAKLGFMNATGCSSIYGSSFPYNPYPFPWSNHLFQDAASVSLGLFEGHMRSMAEGFKTIRMAESELKGEGNFKKLEEDLRYFNWEAFTDDEYLLSPPVIAVGGDGAMFDIGFQNVSRALMSGRPIKIFVLDTQVYSNTGGQACTSGFIGQVSDMAPYGKAWKGKTETRKEMALIAAAHRTAFILQGSIANYTHLIEGYIDGMNTRRPALFSIYSVCQPEHGVPDDSTAHRSKMALESRAYPLFRFDPDAGGSWEECIDMDGNPSMEADWPVYKLEFTDENDQMQVMEIPMTFADFAVGEARFRKHFRVAPSDTWNDNMVPLAEFIDLEEDERNGLFPYIWSVDKKNQLLRVLVAAEIVRSTEERRDYWRTLKGLAGLANKVDPEEIAAQVRGETAQKLAQGLMSLLAGDGASFPIDLPADSKGSPVSGPAAPSAGFEAAFIDQSECTACDECVNINPKIFKYDENKKAFVDNPRGGPYKDIVRAAEKCTGACITPGTPADPNEKGVDKLIKRAAKFQ